MRSYIEGRALSAVALGMFCLAGLWAAPARAQKVVPKGPPVYKVDPFWPKPLPNKWSMQQIVHIYVDKEDHVWFLNRGVDARPDELGAMLNPPRQECCILGPEKSSNSIPMAPFSGLGEGQITFPAGRDGCKLSAWTAKETCGWPAARAAIPS